MAVVSMFPLKILTWRRSCPQHPSSWITTAWGSMMMDVWVSTAGREELGINENDAADERKCSGEED